MFDFPPITTALRIPISCHPRGDAESTVDAVGFNLADDIISLIRNENSSVRIHRQSCRVVQTGIGINTVITRIAPVPIAYYRRDYVRYGRQICAVK